MSVTISTLPIICCTKGLLFRGLFFIACFIIHFVVFFLLSNKIVVVMLMPFSPPHGLEAVFRSSSHAFPADLTSWTLCSLINHQPKILLQATLSIQHLPYKPPLLQAPFSYKLPFKKQEIYQAPSLLSIPKRDSIVPNTSMLLKEEK